MRIEWFLYGRKIPSAFLGAIWILSSVAWAVPMPARAVTNLYFPEVQHSLSTYLLLAYKVLIVAVETNDLRQQNT